MSMDLGGRQKRSLNGALIVAAGGGAVGIPATPTAAKTIHTLDGTQSTSGGFYTDEVTIVVSNPSGTARIVTVFLDGVAIFKQSIPTVSEALVMVDQQPLKRPTSGAAGVLTVQANGGADDDLLVWGWFVRG